MPMRRYRKRSAAKKGRKPRRQVRKRASKAGVIRLTRKLNEQNVYNTATTAVAAASGSVVQIGTPYQTPAFVGSTYYNIPFSMDVMLNDLLSFTELTQIADKYKINWIKVQLRATSNTASAGSVAQLPSIIYSTDEDDAGIPASTTVGLNALREKMTSKVRSFESGRPLTMFFRPKVAMSVANSAGVATNAIVSGPKYIDCNHPDVPHYGLKGYLQDVNLASTASVYTQFKYDITVSVTLKDIQ